MDPRPPSSRRGTGWIESNARRPSGSGPDECGAPAAHDLCDHYGVRIDPVHDSPGGLRVADPQLMTSASYRSHRSRVWQAQHIPLLKAPQKVASLKPCTRRERRFPHLSVQRDERLVRRTRRAASMSSTRVLPNSRLKRSGDERPRSVRPAVCAGRSTARRWAAWGSWGRMPDRGNHEPTSPRHS